MGEGDSASNKGWHYMIHLVAQVKVILLLLQNWKHHHFLVADRCSKNVRDVRLFLPKSADSHFLVSMHQPTHFFVWDQEEHSLLLQSCFTNGRLSGSRPRVGRKHCTFVTGGHSFGTTFVSQLGGTLGPSEETPKAFTHLLATPFVDRHNAMTTTNTRTITTHASFHQKIKTGPFWIFLFLGNQLFYSCRFWLAFELSALP